MKTNFKQLKNNFKQTVLKLTLVFAFVLGIAGLGVNAYAAAASSTATGDVVTPITIAKTGAVVLNFGTFSARGASTSTVIVTTGGLRTGSTATLLVGGTPAAASFTVGGLASAVYVISHTGDTLTNTTGNGAETMTLSDKTVSHGAGDTDLNGALSVGGADTILVGATLTVAANQVAGTYTGDITVTVNYN